MFRQTQFVLQESAGASQVPWIVGSIRFCVDASDLLFTSSFGPKPNVLAATVALLSDWVHSGMQRWRDVSIEG